MTKILRVIISLFVLLFSLIFPHIAHADPPDELDNQEVYVRAKVLQVISANLQTFDGAKTYNETLKAQIIEGKEKNKIITLSYSNDATFGIKQKINNGALIIVDSKPLSPQQMYYSLYEPYRLNNLWLLLGAFILLIVVVVGKKGIGAIVGLAISLSVILWYIMPQILKGHDPLTVCIFGALFILFVTTYIAHGISIKTTVALIGTALSLFLAALFSLFIVQFMYLLGLGDQNSYTLQLATTHQINPQGILLGGIIIGTLGALNDITTTQAITIFTLAKEDPKQHINHLFWKSMHIGREHIISMINTLVLAYAGSSLAIFLFFAFNPANLPWWLILNDQLTMEEIVRALVGSTALILAIPITTILGSYIALNKINFSYENLHKTLKKS